MAARGKELQAGLDRIRAAHWDVIRDVRGKGLMMGLEFEERLGYGFASDVSLACLQQGMLILTTSAFPAVRFIPPLNVSKDEVEVALTIFEQAVKQTRAKHKA